MQKITAGIISLPIMILGCTEDPSARNVVEEVVVSSSVPTISEEALPSSNVAPPSEPPRVHDLKVGVFADGILSSAETRSVTRDMNSMFSENSGLCRSVSFRITRGPEKFSEDIPRFVGNGNFRSFENLPILSTLSAKFWSVGLG